MQLDIYRTAIPMRSFEHAAASRQVAEAIIVRLELSDGSVGWGETLPRQYVTGETLETVPADIENILWLAATGSMDCGGCDTALARPPTTKAASQPPHSISLPGIAHGRLISDLPCQDSSGRPITAARCAVELAMIDAMGDGRVGGGRSSGDQCRVSGVLGSADPAKTAKRLRLMRLFGLRDFKLKLGLGDGLDRANLELVYKRIGKAVSGGKCTLRVDVNGGWSVDQTPARVHALRPYGVCVVEQPAFCSASELVDLARRCSLPLMADESLITLADAQTLISAGAGKVWLNIRLSKNGGLGPCRSMARMADDAGVPYTFGCMVGESGILSAAQRLALRGLRPAFVEGNYGKFLLADDLTRPSPRFGYGGRLRPLPGQVKVLPARLEKYGTHLKTLT